MAEVMKMKVLHADRSASPTPRGVDRRSPEAIRLWAAKDERAILRCHPGVEVEKDVLNQVRRD